jgi:(p)ppGpp synthase/HD superfamily hydrolase
MQHKPDVFPTVLTDRFDRALLYATHIHGGQVRKGTSTPYVAHLLAVAATVLEYGGDEDLAIAALLHDIVYQSGRASCCGVGGFWLGHPFTSRRFVSASV